MAFEFGALDASLAAAVGDNPALIRELRDALLESARHHANLLARSRCDANWHGSAWRIKSLAASFGAMELMHAATDALESAPGDPVALRRISRAIDLIASG
jgi:HPt (histidine-containing phosphotransfer) domain-containing protein